MRRRERARGAHASLRGPAAAGGRGGGGHPRRPRRASATAGERARPARLRAADRDRRRRPLPPRRGAAAQPRRDLHDAHRGRAAAGPGNDFRRRGRRAAAAARRAGCRDRGGGGLPAASGAGLLPLVRRRPAASYPCRGAGGWDAAAGDRRRPAPRVERRHDAPGGRPADALAGRPGRPQPRRRRLEHHGGPRPGGEPPGGSGRAPRERWVVRPSVKLLATASAIALAVAPGAAQSTDTRAVVWAAGDAATPGRGADRIAALVRRGKPDLFLYLGDVYETGTRLEFRRWYHPRFGSLGHITEPTIGNHEWGNRFTGYYPYWAARKGRRQPPWSKTEIAGWEIINLNSQAAHGAGSSQVRWLERALTGPGDCRIAFWHRPRYSAGAYRGANDLNPFWNRLVGRARIVLSGHDHNLQRHRPQRGVTQYVV